MSIPLNNKIIKVLQNYKNEQDKIKFKLGSTYVDNDLLFCIENGKPKEPRNFFRKFKEIIKEAGLPDIRFYDMRHTFSTLALEEGVSMKVLQEILGH